MRKLIYVLLPSLLLLNSCSNDEKTIAPAEDKIVETGVITSASTFPFITKYDQARMNSGNSRARVAKTQTLTLFGPFTTTATLTKLLSLQKIFLISPPAPYSAGFYFCDVYESKSTVELPADAIMSFNGLTGTSKIGYSNYTSQTEGVNYTQTSLANGNVEYTFNTFSLVTRYNIAGQSVYYFTLPRDLTGNVYTYKYIRDI